MKYLKSTLLLIAFAALLVCITPNVYAARGGQLILTVVDQKTKLPISCRLHLYRGPKQRVHKIKGYPFWNDHIAIPGNITLNLPKGEYYFEIERGLEYVTRKGQFTIETFADDHKTVDLRRFVDMSEHGWWSGDFDVRRPIDEIELLMAADDLHVAMLLGDVIGGKKPSTPAQKMPVCFDKDRYYSTDAFETRWPGTTLYCFNNGTLANDLRLGPERLLSKDLLPLEQLEAVHKSSEGWIDVTRPFWWDLPVLVAENLVDSVEIAHPGFQRQSLTQSEKPGRERPRNLYPGKEGSPRWTQDIYFKLIDAGFRIPPSAGSGTGDVSNPIGYNRMYVYVDGPMSYEKWWASLEAGRVTVTNGPLLRPTVEGRLPGYTFQADEGEPVELEIGLTLSTRDPISYLEIIKNGEVEKTIPFADYASTGQLPKIRFEKSGWFLLRAVNDMEQTYRFAMTAPYYVQVGYDRRISRSSVQFFIDWIDERLKQLGADAQAEQLDAYRRAKVFWEDLAKKANAE